jgi:hypothetical protein
VDWITAGFMDTSEGWKKIPAWTTSANVNSATFEDHEYGSFAGQLKLTPTQPIYRLETIPETNGTAAFGSVGLDGVYTAGSSYGGSLLEVLDAIKDSREGAPVFRAQLFSSLVGISARCLGAFLLSGRQRRFQKNSIHRRRADQQRGLARPFESGRMVSKTGSTLHF